MQSLNGMQTKQAVTCKAFSAGPIRQCQPARRQMSVRSEAQQQQAETSVQIQRRTVLGAGLAVTAATSLPLAAPPAAKANKILSADWEQVDLPLDKGVVLLDMAFTGTDPSHGFLLGTRQTLLETFDGGKTWNPRSVEAARDEGFNYRFNSISFNGDEGWIVGKPAILLHTADGGKNWDRIPLSNKLPGVPVLVSALPGKGQAEMTTDQGAIYATNNTAYTWTAAVEETVDATLNRTVSSGISGASYYEGSFSNVQRNSDGEYVAVSSRGNFYMTWAPGQTYWQPHNRPAARRVQNMGWTPDNKMWLTTRGGAVFFAPEKGIGSEQFDETEFNSRGFGILDIGFKTNDIAFTCGGSGSLYKSTDGGKTWKRDKSADDVGGNLYAIKFYTGGNGFILGNDGILLKYIGAA